MHVDPIVQGPGVAWQVAGDRCREWTLGGCRTGRLGSKCRSRAGEQQGRGRGNEAHEDPISEIVL